MIRWVSVGSGGARPGLLANRKRKGEVKEGLGRVRRIGVPEPRIPNPDRDREYLG